VEPEIDKIHEQLRMLGEQTQSDEDSANSKILKVQDSIHQFDNVDNDIKAYQLAGGDDRLAAAKKAVTDLDKQVDSIDEDIMQLSIAISEAESNIANMRQLERNVADNLRCREMQRDITRMRNKISEMEQENAETEVDKYKERAEKLRKANNKWTAEVFASEMELTSSKQRWEERSSKWICNCRNITSN
jgi:chromosome segregation ATPase